MSRRLLALLAVLALVAPALAAGPAAAQEYTISDLKEGGTQYATDSQRLDTANRRIYWLEHSPPSQPWVTVDKGSNGPKLAAGDTLTSNRLYLRTLVADEGGITKTVKIVSWQRGSRSVKTGNTTTSETVATNVSTTTQQVQFDPIQGVAEVSLPNHAETHQITMWVEDAPSEARWRFEHKSVATTQQVNVSTWGDLLFKIVQYVGLTALFGGVLVGRKVRSMVDAAGVGPDWGFGKWTAAITVLTALVGGLAYAELAQAIVYVPYLLGVWLTLVFGAYTLATHRGDIKTKGLLQPLVEDSVSVTDSRLDDTVAVDGEVSADGGHAEGGIFAHDVLQGVYEEIRVIEDESGMSIVRPGIVSFLARVYGARARIENIAELTQRFRITTGEVDEMILVDPEADEVLDYQPPSFEWDFPDLDSRESQFKALVAIGGAGVLTWQLAAEWGVLVYIVAALVATAVAAKMYLRPVDGHARIEPAPMHFRNVFASTMVLRHGLRDVKDLSQAKQQARLEQLKTKDEAQEELDDHDRAMMDHFAGVDDTDIDDVLTGGDDADGDE